MEAVTQFEGRDLKRHTLLQVGRAYLDHLLFEQKFDQAGKLCLKILGESRYFDKITDNNENPLFIYGLS
jgi:hypothetical protein